LLCVIGAVSIFGVPRVQGDPLLQLFAALWSLLCLWAVVISVRLILGLRGRFGFFGPVALRIAAVAASALVVAGAFTGIYVEHPIRGGLLAITYVFISIKLWRLATQRARRAT